MKRMKLIVDMNNGDQFEVLSATTDYVAYDDTAKRQRPPWGAMSENVARWEAFIAWHALKRVGKYTGSWDSFLDDAVNVDGQPLDSGPTLLGATADS
jgi:hypothetical protein